jgi:hypothetical protein
MGEQRVDARIILKSIFTQKNVKVIVVSGTELYPRANWCTHANITYSYKQDGINRDKLIGY